MNYKGTSGNDDFDGTSGRDVFNMVQGGQDSVDGGGGADIFRFGASFGAGDQVDGGAGIDQLRLDGDYASQLFVNVNMLANVEKIVLGAGHDYSFAFFDGVIAHGAGMTVQASALGVNDEFTIDGGYMTAASADTTLIVYGGASSTHFTGSYGTNIFHGGSGHDFVYFGADLGKDDRIDGGMGNDTLVLTGDYSAGLTLSGTMLKNMEGMTLGQGYDFKFVTTDTLVQADGSFVVYGGSLAAGDTLIFNGAHESDGYFIVYDGQGDDIVTGGAKNDYFNSAGGIDKYYGNAGNDQIQMSGHLAATDHVDGGSGTDELDLNGDYSAGLTFKATTMVNVETMFLNQGFGYSLTMNDGNVAAGQTLSILADSLSQSDVLTVNAAAETDGSYAIYAGNGDDALIGGQAGNMLYGYFGQDHMTAGLGADTFLYLGAGESTGVTRDIVTGFDAAHDHFDLNVGVLGIDASVVGGALGTGHFDDNLAAAIDAAHLAVGHAVLFTPDSGNLHGHVFLVVDANGQAGYQAGADFVIQLDGVASLATGNFT